MTGAAADRITVIGAGAWGTTLARMLADAGQPVTLWSHRSEFASEMAGARENVRYLPGHAFPAALAVTGNDADLGGPHRLYLAAVPSAHLRRTMRRLAPHLTAGVPVLSVVKGIESDTQARMSEVIADEAPGRAVAVLSGPNMAREIASGLPAGTVVASQAEDLAAEVALLLGSDRFRVYTSPDVTGVELAGALKNVVALAAGMSDGLAFGDSGKAAIITRGLAEMTRLGLAAEADPRTFAGLAGVGDLIVTCMSRLSRNRRAGELLASGQPWAEVAGQLNGVAEGVDSVAGALTLAARLGVEMPIAAQVAEVIAGTRQPLEALATLMARSQKDELAAPTDTRR